MAFVKLDTGILQSTIWFDKEARDVFLTSLLMALPMEIEEPMPQIQVDSLNETGWCVPPGWYGFVPAAGVGILRMAGVPEEVGIPALERLGSPEPDSRSQDFDGRRLVRIDGGYVVLNFMRYRQKDHTAAQRMRRLRAKRKAERYGVTPSHDAVTERTVTDSRGQSTEAEGRKEEPVLPPADRAERAIQETTDALRTRLYALISEMTDEDPKKRDPTELMRLVTAYDKQDGKRIKGVVNAHLLTHERVEKSIADAEAILADWRKARGAGHGQAVQQQS